MSNVLLIIQLIISIILTGLILIQRSEGGGGLMSGRSATTSIARVTAILGVIFLVNCLALSVVYQIENRDNLILDDETVSQPLTAPVDSSEGSVPLADENTAEDAGPEQDK